jgi:hypothetical protein
MPAQPPARAGQADVVIAGGGPVGLMLACELRLSGTDPTVLERLPGIDETPKGNGLAGQIVPVLDYRGLLDRLRQEATFAGPVPRFSFGPLQLDFSRLGTRDLNGFFLSACFASLRYVPASACLGITRWSAGRRRSGFETRGPVQEDAVLANAE